MGKLHWYANLVRGRLSVLDRNKLVALITIEVHARDVIVDLLRKEVKGDTDFEWLKQLRFYWYIHIHLVIFPAFLIFEI